MWSKSDWCQMKLINQQTTKWRAFTFIPMLGRAWYHQKIKTLNYNTPPISCRRQIFDEICPFTIPNQISIISMHIPSLVKIHWCLLMLLSRNKKTDGWTYNWRMDRHMDAQRETIIPRHYCVAGYKKNYNIITISSVWYDTVSWHFNPVGFSIFVTKYKKCMCTCISAKDTTFKD